MHSLVCIVHTQMHKKNDFSLFPLPSSSALQQQITKLDQVELQLRGKRCEAHAQEFLDTTVKAKLGEKKEPVTSTDKVCFPCHVLCFLFYVYVLCYVLCFRRFRFFVMLFVSPTTQSLAHPLSLFLCLCYLL